ncbi:MAG TPA: hypothetical protein VGI47_03395 [Candidatus Binataceae bacterium]
MQNHSTPNHLPGGAASSGGAYSMAPVERMLGLHQILPCQYFDLSGGHRLSGEQRLMLALLADAINVFQSGLTARGVGKRMLYLEAERWILDSNLAWDAFSFEAACEALDINPSILRRRLIDWKHRVSKQQGMPAAAHLRLKITARPQRLSHQRRKITSRRRLQTRVP